MLHIRKFFIPLIVAVSMTSLVQSFQLEDFNYEAASVLPTFIDTDGVKWIYIAREGFGSSKNTYDDYSGGREKGENNPIIAATREFFEEAIIPGTLGWDLATTERFINPEISNNVQFVIAYSKPKNPKNPESKAARSVTFIVDFTPYINAFFANFYEARKREEAGYQKLGVKGHRPTVEKDRIAKVKWEDFERTIKESKSNNVSVQALVLNPDPQLGFQQENIPLRPFLVIKLRSFFLNKNYELFKNEKNKPMEKARFYKDYLQE